MCRRKRRWTVTGEHPVSDITDVISQAVANQRFASIRSNEHAKHFAARTARQDDFPAQAHLSRAHRQPDQLCSRVAVEILCFELLLALAVLAQPLRLNIRG